MESERDIDHLEVMLELIAHLERRLASATLAQFETDIDEIDLTAFRLSHIGEEGRKLSQGIRDRYPGIDWKSMYQMRNIIAHSYSSIVAERLWKVAHNELDPIKRLCQIELDRLLP